MHRLQVCAVLLIVAALVRQSSSARLAAETDLQLLLKAFARNGDAFDTFVDLLPRGTDAVVKGIYSRWLAAHEGQVQSADIASPKPLSTTAAFSGVANALAATASCTNSTFVTLPPPPPPSPPPPPPPAGSPPPGTVASISAKKGVGVSYFKGVGSALSAAQLSWTYNWWSSPSGVAIPRGVQYVPMISKAQYATASAISAAKATGSGVLLGYNEPDISTQGNNTVAEAVAAWPILESAGLRLGSPAVSTATDGTHSDSWMGQFMAQAAAQSMRVDFIAVHWYGSWERFDDPVGATAALQQNLEAYYSTYGLNIWLTEWCLVDYGNGTNNFAWAFPTFDQQIAFLQAAVPMLESLDYVERYAWFWMFPDQLYDGKYGVGLDTASLVYTDGSFNPTGRAFQAL